MTELLNKFLEIAGTYALYNLLFLCCGIIVFMLYWFNPFNWVKFRWTVDKVKVLLLENFGESFKIVNSKLIPLTYDFFVDGNKAFIIDMKQAIFDNLNRGLLLYDIDTAQPLSIEDLDEAKKLQNQFNLELKKVVTEGKGVYEVLKEKAGKLKKFLNLGYVDSELFNNILKSKIYGKILNPELDKWYMIIIMVLICALVGISAFSMWKISDLMSAITELSKRVVNP